MKRTLIQKNSTGVVKNLTQRVKDLSDLGHKLTKGQLRELFVSGVLNSFLTNQFSTGSGIVINQQGEQSNQTDIVIYDNRILPPFIREQGVGVYPAESVLATIEVKSLLAYRDILDADRKAKRLHKKIYNNTQPYSLGDEHLQPLTVVIGLLGKGVKVLSDEKKGKIWLDKNVKYLFVICHVNQYSWINFRDPNYSGWKFQKFNRHNEETKRFVAVLLDHLRTYSEDRLRTFEEKHHRDWLSIYTRDQRPK